MSGASTPRVTTSRRVSSSRPSSSSAPPTRGPSSALPERAAARGQEAGADLASVIVPTRDRLRPLERCLAALGQQSYEPIEVLVVDDGSRSSGLAALVAAYDARLIPGPRRGPAAARNAGAHAARGAFLCFTDDDCEPESEWVEWLVRRLRSGADAVAGTTASAGGALAD